MPFSINSIPDLTGKTAIVTGGNTGIGFITVKALAKKNAKVYLAARNPARALPAIEEIKKEIPNAKVEFMQLDLSDLKQTKAAAETFVKGGEPLHILVNNAGIMAPPFELTKDGIESQFATNHVGHFAFTTTLLPVIERSAPSRIVNLSSSAHSRHPKEGIIFDRMNDPDAMTSAERYGQSKLANILFSKSLADKLEGKQVWVNAVHPGFVNTELMRGPYANATGILAGPLVWLAKKVVPLVAITPDQGALTQLYAATSPEIEQKNYRGLYFVPIAKLETPVPFAEDKALKEKLWEWSEKIVAEKLAKL